MSLDSRIAALAAAIGADMKLALGAGPPAGALDSRSASLGSDVQLLNSNTFYNGPSVTLEAGTWLINAHVTQVRSATTAEHIYARLTNGTIHYASTQMYHPSVNGAGVSLAMTAIVTLATQTTVHLQCATSAGSTASNMRAAMSANNSGNNATQITAVKIA